MKPTDKYFYLPKDIRNYIDKLCAILDIYTPAIYYDARSISPYALSPAITEIKYHNGMQPITSIHINKPEDDISLEFFYNLAHELRHIYQANHNPDIFRKYKEFYTTSLKKYNEQLAEIDANAFANVILKNFFGLYSTLKDFPKATLEEIDKRAKYIESDLKQKNLLPIHTEMKVDFYITIYLENGKSIKSIVPKKNDLCIDTKAYEFIEKFHGTHAILSSSINDGYEYTLKAYYPINCHN